MIHKSGIAELWPRILCLDLLIAAFWGFRFNKFGYRRPNSVSFDDHTLYFTWPKMEQALSNAPFSSNFLEIINLKYTMLNQMINRLNSIAEYFLDDEGNQLQFMIKKGTDQTFLWKLTIRILATRVSTNDQGLLTLAESQSLTDCSNACLLQVQTWRAGSQVVPPSTA